MRQTKDQQAACQTLRSLAGSYRVTLDREGWPIIVGRHGQIEHRDEATSAVYSRAMRKLSPLMELGARRHQVGDDEYNLLFAPALLGCWHDPLPTDGHCGGADRGVDDHDRA